MPLINLFPRSTSVPADENCLAIELSPASLFEVYNLDPAQFTLMQMNIARELNRRLRADKRLFRTSRSPKGWNKACRFRPRRPRHICGVATLWPTR